MVTIKSDALGGEIVSICETEQEWSEEKDKQTNVVVYYYKEFEEFRGLDFDGVKTLHEAKKIFNGSIGDGMPKPRKNKSLLLEMRDKLREKK
tara:strand:- start:720 stop:995 length:276 start_codon:yes stop_codon:yes gene_type:complete